MTKPMKPAKAWALANKAGTLYETNSGVPILRKTQNNPCDWMEDGDRFVRVRIIEDAAVERAIRAMKDMERLAGKNMSDDADELVALRAAIRDLGGKP